MQTTYEYLDETSIDRELICNICHSPLTDPYCTPCSETFCRECITNWIQSESASCPHCRQALSINNLTQAPRSLRNMLDRLRIKCVVCKQSGLLRVNAEEHIQKVCPKTIVSCQAADIKCSWLGPRDQLNDHLVDCRYEPIRPVITELMAEAQQLEDKVDEQMKEITEQKNEIKRLEEQVNEQKTQHVLLQNENQTLTEQVTQLEIQVNTYQHQNQQLNEQLQHQEAQLTATSDQPRKSIHAVVLWNDTHRQKV